jgi:hypothetical protein
MKVRLFLISVLLLCSISPYCIAEEENTVLIKATGPEIHVTKDAKSRYDFVVPEQDLVTPESVDRGEVIIAKAGNITNPPQYLVAATYRWKVLADGKLKENIQEWPDGSSILFGSGSKSGVRFTIALGISYLYVVKGNNDTVIAIGQRSKLLTKEVKVGGMPEPGPRPPGPGPSPDIPDGRFGLASAAYKLANTIRSPASKTKGAQALASSFRGIASSVAAGTLSDPKDLLGQTKASNQSALRNAGVSSNDWEDFFTELQKILYSLSRSKKLSGVRDFADAWQEIASGLEQVR